jgi:dipeptidyl aminopeptidase/acylaminoacyl peptidase
VVTAFDPLVRRLVMDVIRVEQRHQHVHVEQRDAGHGSSRRRFTSSMVGRGLPLGRPEISGIITRRVYDLPGLAREVPMTRQRRLPSALVCALAAAFLVAAAPTPAPPKRPLSHRDYDAWRTITSPTLSRDGRILAYSYMPQDGDGDLVVRDLTTGQEHREGVGALPPPPIQLPEEVNPESPPPPRGIRVSITSDGRYVVASTYPTKAETQKAKKEKKKADEMPKGGLLIVDVVTGQARRIASVKSFQVPSKGGAWVAYLKEPRPEEKRDEKAEEKKEEKKPERRGNRDKKEYGTDLVLQDLSRAEGGERTFADVAEYTFARDGRTLLYIVSSRNEPQNGVYAATPGGDGPPAVLLAGKGRYAKLTWDREQTQAAFVSDHGDAESKVPKFDAYHWPRGATAANPVVSAETPGFPRDLVVADKGSLGFSRDGRRLYVPAAPPEKPPREESEDAGGDKVLSDLWHWQDDLIQPMQRIRANQERNRTYRGVYHIADGRYVQVADPTLRTVSLSDDGGRAIGYDDRPYRRLVDYDGNYSDVYLVDTATGARRLAIRQIRGGGGFGPGAPGGPGGGGGPLQWSPDGRYAFYYQDRHWHLFDAVDGSTRDVTTSLGVAFHDEDDDTPDPPGSYGNAGWTKDSLSFLVYDRYDVWQVFADGRPARCLTEGGGRRTRTELRVQRIEPRDEDDDERGIDPEKPLYLSAESEETRATGFYRDSFAGTAPPQRLLWGDRRYRFTARARDAEVLLLTASRFDEFPDLQVTDPSFKKLTRVTDGDAQRRPYLWGTAELVGFRNADGVPLQAALYKPEGFDPKKKYPLIVYIYERLSQNVHSFVNPAPGTSINIAHYVSNGYLVLTPDIVYTIGNPGESALKCVLPAVQEVVDRGFVDESAIGIQGHSWGGYQIAYLLTRTRRFRAAEAGAPVGNMTSAYSGIRWGSGLPRQFQYEKTQSRIARPLVEAPHKYLENSPVFHADRVTTPLLILHNDQDDAVPWYQGIELYLALRRGKEVYLFNYNGEFHGLRRRHNQKDFTVRMQQFFDHFLKGESKPEWMVKGIPFLEREEEKERFLERP